MVASISPFIIRLKRLREPFGRAADIDLVARHEAFEQMQREIVRAGVERHADRAAGELLRRVDRRIRPHHDGGIGDDGAAADLAAADAGGAGAAVVAPFAGVVHVGLALLEQRAVAAERIGGL